MPQGRAFRNLQTLLVWTLHAGVYGYGGERSSRWWLSMANAVLGRECSEGEERSLEVLNRQASNVSSLYYISV